MTHTPAPCGCCAGTQVVTPQATANRPGLSALAYRVGVHATFLDTMRARLSSSAYAPLAGFMRRDPGDPAMALLDAWATVADVLTFYQERIANEGYLQTATERRSILSLARLVGYTLQPGVSASAYLAYTLEDTSAPVEIPTGARAQSIPGPGELPQSFETSEPLQARVEWNNLQPRLTRPQLILQTTTGMNVNTIYFQGTTTNLKANDALLVVFNQGAHGQVVRRIETVEAQFADNRTRVTLQTASQGAAVAAVRGRQINAEQPPLAVLQDFAQDLLRLPSAQPANSLRLSRSTGQVFAGQGDTLPQLLTTFQPRLAETAYRAWANATVTPAGNVEVYALRAKAAPFGHNAPLQTVRDATGKIEGYEEWPINGSITYGVAFSQDARELRTVTVSIKRGATTEWHTVPLPQQDQDIAFTIGNVHISPGTSGDAAAQIINYSFTFTDGVVRRTFIITLPGQERAYGVQVDHDVQRTVREGQALHYALGTRTITMAVANDTLTVTEASPGVPAPRNVVALDAQYDQIMPQSWVVFTRADDATFPNPTIRQVTQTHTISPSDYGITGTVTQLTVHNDWMPATDRYLSALRKTTVYAQSELLPLAEEPIIDTDTGALQAIGGATIILGRLYDGLQSGRWLVVSGERADIPGTTGVKASELVMLTGVQQSFDPQLPGDKVHTTLTLANKLAYTYKRDTVTIYGNVVKATHGETRPEVLGSGDASQTLQAFTLKQPPLTYVSAPNPAGVDSTLQVRVNGVEWHETDTLAGRGPNDRDFITRTDDEAKTTVVFGNGTQGARLPTGVENITSVYRNGIGKSGNVKAEQISLLMTRPLGVKAVINPLRASGGADKESRDQARRNVPFAVMALDRLVSTDDYAAFARTFAGIGKASAVRLSDGHRQLVHLTIAGADDIPIDPTSDLYHNLRRALRDYGDPYLPIAVAVRELLALIISAKVRVLPDYQWESVAPTVRSALLDTFSFERRALGQSVFLSEIISVIQHVAGVAYVDVDVLESLSETELADARRLGDKLQQLHRADTPADYRRAALARVATDKRILPAQLLYLTPAVPDTLILNEVTS